MIDPNLLKHTPDIIIKALKDRFVKFNLDEVVSLDKKRREMITELENANQIKNQANNEISQLLKDKKDAKTKIAQMKSVSMKISDLKPKADELKNAVEAKLLLIPNIPLSDVPIGQDASSNKCLKEEGEQKQFSFKPKVHIELGESLGLIDLKRASKISGASFVLFTGVGARLERALVQFMLDTHTEKHGYTEMSPPHLVRRASMQGTGQLPKFEEDMYRIYRGEPDLEDGKANEKDLFLIPTAEVPLTNTHREETLKEQDLPIKYCAYTPCFRLEAGAYGKDTKGMIRVHQFDKVELVKFCKPEDSTKEHEGMLADIEAIFKALGLRYRVQLLATGDMGFSAAKCYDLELWAPGLGQWLEASSCSTFTDFQARRAAIKYKDSKTKKSNFVHTLNGSGVALARTFIALLETYQQSDGSILIPEVLRPYMGNLTHIKPSN